MKKSMFTNNDSSTELAWEVLKKQQACWHTDYCTVSCEECENYVIHRDLEKAIDIIIEEKVSNENTCQSEIITCGDCKHWIRHDKRCGYWNHSVKPLDWCSYAVRKSD